jgi:hypothetical protein
MNPDVKIAELAHDQHGMVTRSQALDFGLTSEQLDHQVERRLILPMHLGVYRHRAVPLTWRGRLMGGVLAGGPAAAASHRSAATLRSLSGVPLFRPEITVEQTDLPIRSGVLVHRTSLLDGLDRAVVDGIPCTTVARTLLDLGAVLPYEVVEQAVQDAVIRKLVTHAELVAILERVGKRGRRGTAKLRVVVRYALPDEKLESELERRLALLLPVGFELQHELVCTDGRRVRLDAALPGQKIAVEGNGFRWHRTRRQVEDDAARRRSIVASGWTHYEYGWSDVVERAAATRAELHSFFVGSTV